MDIEKFLSTEELSYKRMDFNMGMSMLMFLPGIEAPLKIILIGAVADEYIVTSIPKHPGIEARLAAGGTIKIVYMFSGTIFAFASKLLTVRDSRPEHLILSYPGQFHRHELRNANRVSCFVPGIFTCDDGEYDCMILDMSAGGCKIAIQFSDGFPENATQGAAVSVAFQLIGMKQPATCRGEVRNVTHDRVKQSLGIKFGNLDENLKETIQSFIKNQTRFL